MHSVGELGTGVPAFLGKLWRLVEDPETNHLISWSEDGLSFIIQNQAQFARELLPLNYKHNNMASFIRQLNMYGFHKVTSVDNGGLKFDKDEIEFSHICFLKGHPYLLEHIKRKITNTKAIDGKSLSNIEEVSRVLNEVKSMKGRQESLDARFSAMKQENKALWREVAVLRQKHLKQQQIVNKLIQFLVSIVTPGRTTHLPSMGMGVKRPFQLMLGDSPSPPKIAKASVNNVPANTKPPPLQVPMIRELATESNNQLAVELEDCEDDDEYLLESCSSQPLIASPRSNASGGQPSPNRLDDVQTAQLIQTIPSNEITAQNFIAEEINPLELLTVPPPQETTTRGNKSLRTLNDNQLQMQQTDASKYFMFNKSKKYGSVNEDLQVPDMIFENEDMEEQFVDNPDPLVSGGITLDSSGVYNNNNQDLIKKESVTKTAAKRKADSMTLATVPSSSVGKKSLERLNSKDDVDHHLDNVQGELDSLRDLLKGEGYLDANALLGVCGATSNSGSSSNKHNLTLDTGMFFKLFGGDDPLSYGIAMNPADLTEDNSTRSKNYNDNENGLELMTYSGIPDQPDLIDFNDMWVSPAEQDLENDLIASPEELNTPQVGLSTPPFHK